MNQETNNSRRGESEDTFSKSYIDVCSATDCTGLIPALPQSEEELQSYEEIYHFLPRASGTGKDS